MEMEWPRRENNVMTLILFPAMVALQHAKSKQITLAQELHQSALDAVMAESKGRKDVMTETIEMEMDAQALAK